MAKIKHLYFKQLLTLLGFSETSKNIFEGKIGSNKYFLSVDFNNESINYGNAIKVYSLEVCNFEEQENLVVFECVCRLIKQGYSPNSILLEPRWKVGHGASGGKADILVNDKKGTPYLLIECKTFGAEFDLYWKKTLNDGDQLFSYYQQDKRIKFAAMYSSELDGNIINSKYCLISLKDNEEYLKTLGKKAKGYKNSRFAQEAFKVWKDTYNQDYDERGIFENNLPYSIGKTKFLASDLEDVNSSSMYETDKKFKNILRQHNIGSHENAFDKLVNLFLAKIVDEKEYPLDLQFNWRGTSQDDVKSLIDRLQKLYKQGMKDFLNEEVTYVEKKDIDNAFRFYKNDKDAVKTTVLSCFDKLKYYTNNDFAFLDVHNEKLFKQNAQVLLKIVQMLQNFRLKTENHNQFLGDLFEGFLDNGVKQSEGQYFTPLPIVRFIVSSLPLEWMIKNQSESLRMIDYACGAGHFLNEYANQITKFLDISKIHDYFKEIYGIEKEYRLSKVSKVSAFMYSQDEINIIYDDALKHTRVKDNSFNVLIANPPYSVKGFLEVLDDDEKKQYELFNAIDKKSIITNKSIETFFVERAKQLLVSDAIAGIILPASFMTNGNIYIKARSLLLRYFDIISIVEFSNGTFGKTGTPTITLFLRRKKTGPDTCDVIQNRIDAWFHSDFSHDDDFGDVDILNNFFKLIGKDVNDFKTLPSNYIEFKERLFYYYLANTQKNKVLIVKSPAGNKELKNFLGYEWINRNKSFKINYLSVSHTKPDEDGIISSEEGINKIQTPLFNPKNFDDDTKINTLIRKNYLGEEIIIPDNLTDYVSQYNLIDLLKFKSDKFDLQINTTPPFKVDSKYKLIEIGKVAKILQYPQLQANQLEDLIDNSSNEVKLLPSSKDYDWWTSDLKAGKNSNDDEVIAIGQARYANIKYWNGKFVSSNNVLIKSIDEAKFKTKFLYYIFSIYSHHFYKRTGQYPAFNTDNFNDFEMPNVPLNIQNSIIEECSKLEKNISILKDKINANQKQILDSISKSNNKSYILNFDKDLESDTGSRVISSEVDITGIYQVISANVNNIFGWINKAPNINDFSKDFILRGLDGDWMTRIMPKNTPFYPTDHCGWICVKDSAPINVKYFRYVLELEGKRERFSRTKRPTYERIKALDIRLPELDVQNQVIKEIEPLEVEIEKYNKQINDLPKNLMAIVEKYIK